MLKRHFSNLFTILDILLFFFSFFFYQGFLSRTLHLTEQQGKKGRGSSFFFHSTTSTRSRTFRHLFATLHVRWLSQIFNRTPCIYQTATREDLPPYRITIWLIWLCDFSFLVSLRDDLILAFLLQHLFFYINIYTLNKKICNHQAYIYMLWYTWEQKNMHIKHKKTQSKNNRKIKILKTNQRKNEQKFEF